MSDPDCLRLLDPDTIVGRTIKIGESIHVDLTFEDRIVRIVNMAGPVTMDTLRLILIHTPWVPMPSEAITLPDGYEYCTTDGGKRRHISKFLAGIVPNRTGIVGRAGGTLCGHYGMDQELVNWKAKGAESVTIAALPLCGGCLKTLKRLVG